MDDNCPICGAAPEFMPKSEYVTENTMVACSNESCVNHQQYAHIDEWRIIDSLSPCPICDNNPIAQPYYYSNYGTVIKCSNTSDCFSLIGDDTKDAVRKWNNIAKIIGNRKEN